MDLALIEKLMRLLEASDLQELDVNEGGMRIRLAKKRSGGAVPDCEPVVATPQPPGDEPEPLPTSHRIIAGMAGTFYRSPSPDKGPYVQEGDRVSDNTVVCIVEAMKLMNEIQAETSGEIVKIYVENGQPVEYGQPLFGIRK